MFIYSRVLFHVYLDLASNLLEITFIALHLSFQDPALGHQDPAPRTPGSPSPQTPRLPPFPDRKTPPPLWTARPLSETKTPLPSEIKTLPGNQTPLRKS